MNIHATDVSAKCRVPVERILEGRSSFPHINLSFEVEFEADGLGAISDLALLIKRSGLTCDYLRYCDEGRIFARLCDSKSSNFQLLDAALIRHNSVSLVRWTTVLSRRFN